MSTRLQTIENTQDDAGCSLPASACYALPPVLDACCGSRMMWFNKSDPRAMGALSASSPVRNLAEAARINLEGVGA